MAIRIPEQDRGKLAVLLQQSQAGLDQLYEVLKSTSPRLRVADLVSDIRNRTDIPAAPLRDVVAILVTLSWLTADQQLTSERMVDEVFQAADDADDERLKVSDIQKAAIRASLVKLLSLDRTLGVTAKALYIAYQYPRHYHESRVFTDARPVFTRNPAEPPSAFIITHSLQLRIHDDGTDREWFLSLDSSDLLEIKEAVDRALEKEKSLRTLMSKTGVPVLDWKEEGDHAN